MTPAEKTRIDNFIDRVERFLKEHGKANVCKAKYDDGDFTSTVYSHDSNPNIRDVSIEIMNGAKDQEDYLEEQLGAL